MKNLSMMKKKQLGQGMTEYIVIVALIAVAAIGAYGYFGEAVQQQVAGLANEIAGQSADTHVANAGTAAAGATTSVDSDTINNMATFSKSATSSIK